MLHILFIISPLFLIILLGFFLSKLKIANNWQKTLNEFSLKIGFPSLIFLALSQTSFSWVAHYKILLINFVFLFSVILLFFFAGKILNLTLKTQKTLIICSAFSNVAYLGLPVVENVLGRSSIPDASIIVSIYLIMVFVLSVSCLEITEHENIKFFKITKSLLKNPLLTATILGLTFSILNIDLPIIITQSLQIISSSVTPIVLLVIGLFLGQTKIGKIKDWFPIFVFSVFTLFVFPAILFFSIKLLGEIPRNFSKSIILASMPLAITPFALSDQYDLHSDFIAKSISLSTVLSIITIPFWVWLLQ